VRKTAYHNESTAFLLMRRSFGIRRFLRLSGCFFSGTRRFARCADERMFDVAIENGQ